MAAKSLYIKHKKIASISVALFLCFVSFSQKEMKAWGERGRQRPLEYGMGLTPVDYTEYTQDSNKAHTYDYENRLITLGTTKSFTYDFSGKRVKAVRSGTTTKYIYDAGGNLIAEADQNNAILRYYVYGHGLISQITPANQVYTYHYDGNGNTVAITDSQEAVVNRYQYEPFGKTIAQEETITNPFKFVGQYGIIEESKNLYYMRARYYDCVMGRFISEDPIGFGGGDVNLYRYVGNNPVGFVDPSGLDTYYINNKFNSSTPTNSVVSHSFVALTKRTPQGVEYVDSTYSWTNIDGGSWQETNNRQNRLGAQIAIASGVGVRKEGDSSLDSYVRSEFDSRQTEVGGYNVFTKNCKQQAVDLINGARSLQSSSNKCGQ